MLDAESSRDDPPPPGRDHRGQDGDRRGSQDGGPGDGAQPGNERRRAQLPHEKPQYGDAGGQAQQRQAEPAECRTDPGRHGVQGRHCGYTGRPDTSVQSPAAPRRAHGVSR